MRDLCRLIGWMVVDLIRSRVMLEAEIWTLRQQINVLRQDDPAARWGLPKDEARALSRPSHRRRGHNRKACESLPKQMSVLHRNNQTRAAPEPPQGGLTPSTPADNASAAAAEREVL